MIDRALEKLHSLMTDPREEVLPDDVEFLIESHDKLAKGEYRGSVYEDRDAQNKWLAQAKACLVAGKRQVGTPEDAACKREREAYFTLGVIVWGLNHK
jgi:hypothetical protein